LLIDGKIAAMKWRPVSSVVLVIALFLLAIFYVNVFPGNYGLGITTPKQIILYFNYGELGYKVNASNFPGVVSFAKNHGFTSLMIVIYADHHSRFNNSELQNFYDYAGTQNLTFVPSYYIESMNDSIDVTGFRWVNLDMERLSAAQQLAYYDNVSQYVSLVSVTQPYGETNLFQTKMLIVETYARLPGFWFEQLWFPHGGTICSVQVRDVRTEGEYQSEFQYCLRYSDGVMVFDYPQLLRAGF
jgi:hypothetical protein